MGYFVESKDFEHERVMQIFRDFRRRDESVPWCESVALVRKKRKGRINIEIVQGEFERLSQYLYEVGQGNYKNAHIIHEERTRVLRYMRGLKNKHPNPSVMRNRELIIEEIRGLEGLLDSEECGQRAVKASEFLSHRAIFDAQRCLVTLHAHSNGEGPTGLDVPASEYEQMLILSYLPGRSEHTVYERFLEKKDLKTDIVYEGA
jgi:hypothetical protein